MKIRAILLTVVLLGIYAETQVAQANPPSGPVAHPGWDAQNQGVLGSRAGDDLWKAPTATVNPGSLIADDSTNPSSLARSGTSSFGPKSFQLMNAFKGDQKDFESAKPIEKIEAHTEAPLESPPPAVPAPKHGSHRIAIVATISVALLAFRKFRRGNASLPPQKPSFL